MLLEREESCAPSSRITTTYFCGLSNALVDYHHLAHMVNHTSGIKSYTSVDNFMSTTLKIIVAPAHLSATSKIFRPYLNPKTFLYNNSGYHLLGLIIEKIAGMSYRPIYPTTHLPAAGTAIPIICTMRRSFHDVPADTRKHRGIPAV